MSHHQETAAERPRKATWLKALGLGLVLTFALAACTTPAGGGQEPEPEPEPSITFADARDRLADLGTEVAQIQTDLSSPPVALALLVQLAASGLELPMPEPAGTMQLEDTVLLPRGQWEGEWLVDANDPFWWRQEFSRVGDLDGSGEFELDFSIPEFHYTEDGVNLVNETPANLSADWEHNGTDTEILDLDSESIELPRHMVGSLVYGAADEPLADVEVELDPVVLDVTCDYGEGVTDDFRMLSLTRLLASGSLGAAGTDFFVNVIDSGFELVEAEGRLSSTGDIEVHVVDHDLAVDWVFEFTTEGDIEAILDLTGCGAMPEPADSTVSLELAVTLNEFGFTLDADVTLDASANTADVTLVVGIDDLGTFEVVGTISLDGTTENPFADLTFTFADAEYTFEEFVNEIEALLEG